MKLKINEKVVIIMSKVPVYKITIMEQLVRMGYHLVGACPNKNNEKVCVFFFESTPELHEALESLK